MPDADTTMTDLIRNTSRLLFPRPSALRDVDVFHGSPEQATDVAWKRTSEQFLEAVTRVVEHGQKELPEPADS